MLLRDPLKILFQQYRSKPVSLEVSKCFPVCPRKRPSDLRVYKYTPKKARGRSARHRAAFASVWETVLQNRFHHAAIQPARPRLIERALGGMSVCA
jgi:hypothetical protein